MKRTYRVLASSIEISVAPGEYVVGRSTDQISVDESLAAPHVVMGTLALIEPPAAADAEPKPESATETSEAPAPRRVK